MTDFQAIYNALLEHFGDEIIIGQNAEAIDPWIEAAPGGLLDLCRFLRDEDRFQFDHLNDLTVVDYLQPDPKKAKRFPYEPHIEVVYHLSSFASGARLVLKVPLPRWRDDQPQQLPQVPSVADIWPAANWHEREAFDLLGVEFIGHPDFRRIMMPEDWPGHPLRKDYTWPEEYHGIRTQ